MELNYAENARLIDIRMRQIDDASREHQYFNKEWVELNKIRNAFAELILLERFTPTEYVDKLNTIANKEDEDALETEL